MEGILFSLSIYAVVFVSGFPFLFLCGHRIWVGLCRGAWAWDEKRKLLAWNAVAYLVFYLLTLAVLVKIFGVGQDLRQKIEHIQAAGATAIRQGDSPSRNNVALGILKQSASNGL